MNVAKNALIAFTLTAAGGLSGAPVDFVRDVQPIFQKQCTECHGEKKQKSGLRLDVKAAALKGGDEHDEILVAGNAAESPLIARITSDDEDERMPPPGKDDRQKLSGEEIATLTRWIDEGAVWPDGVDVVKLEDRRDYWSFKPVANTAPPATKDGSWPRNDVDYFILERLEREGLHPSPEVDRVSWLRRVSFDLIGLPPSPEQVNAFVKDASEGAYTKSGGRVARVAPLRRTLGAALAGRRSLRGHAWLRSQYRTPERLAVSRLRHSIVQQGHAVRPVHPRADRRRCARARTRRPDF